ncbi:hypothetical protein Cni_G16823 [Canna indica]|uniref:DUF868 domain-containing protein n=1 Tax=Canna indica TaxID=4628 RepID=A0AAQ3QG07_9LILI|nr:hypothetical protein Cni_G16823 [Canna indica]
MHNWSLVPTLSSSAVALPVSHAWNCHFAPSSHASSSSSSSPPPHYTNLGRVLLLLVWSRGHCLLAPPSAFKSLAFYFKLEIFTFHFAAPKGNPVTATRAASVCDIYLPRVGAASIGRGHWPCRPSMRDFPSCFGESGVQISDSSSSGGAGKTAQNLVTCLYRTRLGDRSCVVGITWSRTLMGQGFSIGIDDSDGQCLCKVDIKPWLFSKRKGSKCLEMESSKVDIFWDLSAAKFGTGPEPLEGYYVAVVFDLETVLLLGDLAKEAYRKTTASPPTSNTVFVAKREHVYGKKLYCTKAQFCDNGQAHDVVIECDTAGLKDPCLEIRIDKKRVLQVKRLGWKFRGNQTILVDGLPVEVFWDVHSWLFGAPCGNAVFMFQTCLSDEKLLPWSVSQGFRQSQSQGVGFSLILYAWKYE